MSRTRTYVRPHPSDLMPIVGEHMFPQGTSPKLTRRALNALSLARSFLLLEDDHVRDWEVAEDEPGPGGPREQGHVAPTHEHPHRVWLRKRPRRARAGSPAPVAQVCLCPTAVRGTPRRSSSASTGRPHADRVR